MEESRSNIFQNLSFQVMAMKNRYRSGIRDASLNPPKFISFVDFVKQRHAPVSKKPTKEKGTQKPTSETAGVLPEMKKLEDLDLSAITDLRKEALNGIDQSSLKEMGKWGSNKMNDKVVESLPKRSARGDSGRNLSKGDIKRNEMKENVIRNVPSSESRNPTQANINLSKPSLPTHSLHQLKPVETRREAMLIDMTLNLSTKGMYVVYHLFVEVTCMLGVDKSIMTLPCTTRLSSYFVCCSVFIYESGDIQDNGVSLKGVKEDIVNQKFVFAITTEQGHEVIVVYYSVTLSQSSLIEDDMVIPPDDFIVEERKQNTSTPSRAFFKRGGRGRGRSNRGRPPRGGYSRGRGRHFYVCYQREWFSLLTLFCKCSGIIS